MSLDEVQEAVLYVYVYLCVIISVSKELNHIRASA